MFWHFYFVTAKYMFVLQKKATTEKKSETLSYFWPLYDKNKRKRRC